MVHQIAILNTVFGDDRSFCVGAIAHSENILGRHVVFRHSPAEFLGFINDVCVMIRYQQHFVPLLLLNRQYREFLAVHVVVRGE